MGDPQAMDASVYRLGEPQLQEQCSGIECTVADAVGTELLLLAGLSVTALLFVAVSYLRTARTEATEERSRVTAERDAFQQFRRRVEGIQVTSMRPGAGGSGRGGTTFVQSQAADTQPQLEAVRRAYRETVMSVPHYEDDYDEPLGANMATELGEEVALAVVDGDRLTPQIKGALVRKSAEAKTERESFRRALDEEREWLIDAHESLSEVDAEVERIRQRPRLQQSFPSLAEDWRQLDELEDDCAAVLEERQAYLESGATNGGWREDGFGLCEYLFSSLPVAYPVLADGALLVDRIRTSKRQIVDSLTRRV